MRSRAFSALPPFRRAVDGLIVAVLVGSGGLGGAERSTIELAAADRAAGGRFVVIARDRGHGQVSQLAERLGVPLVRVKGLRGAVRTIRSLRPMAVWPFGLRWSLLLRVAVHRPFVRDGRGRRPALVSAQRGLDTWRRPWHNFVDRSTQSSVDCYLANSYAARDMLIEAVGIDAERAVTMWSGVGEEWLGPLPPRVVRDRARVIMVGTDRSEKGHPDALVALAELAGRDDWLATIYTSRETNLDSLVAEMGLGGHVTVVRDHSLTTADYDSADVLLHSSRAESLPRAVLEALSRGLAVVATDVGDVGRLVGGTGVVVAAGDTDAMTRALGDAIDAARTPPDPDVVAARRARCPSQATVIRELRDLLGSLP